VFNRGNSKQKIFLLPADYQRFCSLLYLANTTDKFNIRDTLKNTENIFSIKRSDTLVDIHAVCLMPNHYHLILTPKTEAGLSTFMLKLGTGYSMYFNTRHERTGSLFEGRFKAKHIDNDNYLKYLFSYIHLNPLSLQKKGVFSLSEKFLYLNSYEYSSLNTYTKLSSPRAALGLRESVTTDMFKQYFENIHEVKRELFDWITLDDEISPALGQP